MPDDRVSEEPEVAPAHDRQPPVGEGPAPAASLRPGATMTAEGVVRLQRLIGNRATGQVLAARRADVRANLSRAAPRRILQRFTWAQMKGGVSEDEVRQLIEDSKAGGGHADERHIYIDWRDLMKRELSSASAFDSEADALDCIAEIINAHLGEIADHVDAAPTQNKDFVWKTSFPELKVRGYGWAAASGAGFGSVGAEVTVVLRYRPQPGGPAQIILTTAYPSAAPSETFFDKRRQKNQWRRHRKKAAQYKKKTQKSHEKYLDAV